MKRKSFLAIFLVALALFTTSCGTGDKIGSVQMTVVGAGGGVVNLAGMGGTLQLQVLAIYTSGKQINETNFATYVVTPEGSDDSGAPLPTPPLGMSLNKTGLITATETASGGGICVWDNLGTTAQPSWFYNGDYKIIATYRGFSSNPVYIPVASAADPLTGQVGQCGPA